MDRKKLVRWDALLPICLALASGCESRSTPGQTDRLAALAPPTQSQSAASEPRRLPGTVLPAGFHPQDPASGYLRPQMDLGVPETTLSDPGQYHLGDEQIGSLAAEPVQQPAQQAQQPTEQGQQPAGPSLTVEMLDDLDAELPQSAEVTRLPATDPADGLPLISETSPTGSDATPENAQSQAPAGVRQPQPTPLTLLPPAAAPPSIDQPSIDPPLSDPQPIELSHEPPRIETPPVVPSDGGAPPVATVSQERLPLVEAPARSPEMEAIAQSADELIRQGFRLAERGAVFSARLKFFAALSLVARTLDVQEQTQVHMGALVAGREALVEAWDFRASGLPITTDMARIVAAHRTPVLAGMQLDSLSPVSAQQRYFTYAQEQLAKAAGREPVCSLALYGLGKSVPAVHDPTESQNMTIAGEQMACYQAALLVDDRNFRAAHELGVILAMHGRLEAARDLFSHSLAISESAATWRNLSVVSGRLGDPQQSLKAARRADELMSTRMGSITGANLRWVDPETFARAVPPSEGLVAPSGPTGPPTAAPAQPPKKRVAQWPWKQTPRQ